MRDSALNLDCDMLIFRRILTFYTFFLNCNTEKKHLRNTLPIQKRITNCEIGGIKSYLR